MTMLTAARSPTRRQETAAVCRFSLFALVLSFALVMLGLFSAEHPQPEAATGDPVLFVLQP